MKGLTHEQRKRLKSEIVEYRKQGHYASECAEHFGVSVGYVHRSCKGIDYPWKYDTETMSNAAKEQNKDKRGNPETAIRHINKSASWCEYVGGYTSWQCYVDVRCKRCGTYLNMSFTTLRAGLSKCPECEKKKRAIKHKEEIRLKENKRIEKIASQKHEQRSFRICKACGNVFIPLFKGNIYCSKECLKRVSNAIQKDKRVCKIKARERDSNITLEKLYQRHNGVCAICGTLCNWNDFHYSKGIFIADNEYPSIDHIVPLSKGGKHKWENVQLAHRICNTKKGNGIALPVAML